VEFVTDVNLVEEWRRVNLHQFDDMSLGKGREVSLGNVRR